MNQEISLGPGEKIILNLKLDEFECCPGNKEQGNSTELIETQDDSTPDQPEPGTTESSIPPQPDETETEPEPEPQPEPEPEPEPQPEPEPEPEPQPEKCPDAPIKEGTYLIKTTDEKFSWELTPDKIVLKNPTEEELQKFSFSFTDDCNYFISNGEQSILPFSSCETSTETHQVTHETSTTLDVLFIIDATGSMGGTIQKVKDYSLDIAEVLSKDLSEYSIKYGAVYYRDPLEEYDWEGYPHVIDFTDNMAQFSRFVKQQSASGGAYLPEDTNGAFAQALKLSWRDGVKLIIHITDAPGHGPGYNDDQYEGGNFMREAQSLDQKALQLCDMKGLFIKGLRAKSGYDGSPEPGWKRMNELCRKHRKEKGEDASVNLIEIKDFNQNSPDKSYFTDMIVTTTKETIEEYKETCKIILTTGEEGEKWEVVKDGDYYSFKASSGDVVQVEDGKMEEMTPLIVEAGKGGDNEKFVIVEAP